MRRIQQWFFNLYIGCALFLLHYISPGYVVPTHPGLFRFDSYGVVATTLLSRYFPHKHFAANQWKFQKLFSFRSRTNENFLRFSPFFR